MKKLTTSIFIKNAKSIHGDKYDYSLVEYYKSSTKIKIMCPEHGVFQQIPNNHVIQKQGCPICGGNEKLTTSIFIKNAKSIHGDKYDYSLVEYKNNKTKVKIICPEHGVFEQTPNSHIGLKTDCFKCVDSKKNNNEFIDKSKSIHGDKYDYSLVEYKNNKTKVKIICPEHGVFEQRPNNHYKCGCEKCSNKHKPSNEEFITKCLNLHNNIYDYSLVEYKNAHSKIKIICKKHGVFEQSASHHLRGAGCSNCKISKGEIKIKEWLDGKNIKYIQQYKFIDCKDINPLPFDFYLPEYNMCIEYDGRQHYEIIEIWGGEDGFIDTKKKDNIKNIYCKNNKIKLLRIKYSENVENKLKEIYL
jgi:very-short-patch-repair endonuclease